MITISTRTSGILPVILTAHHFSSLLSTRLLTVSVAVTSDDFGVRGVLVTSFMGSTRGDRVHGRTVTYRLVSSAGISVT